MFTVFVLIDFDGTTLMENNAFSWLTDHKDLLKIEVGLFFMDHILVFLYLLF